MKTKEDYREIYIEALKKYYKTDCLEEKRNLCNIMNLAIFCIANLLGGTFSDAKRYLGIEE